MNILIVKLSSLGDIVHAFPALELLRRQFPHAQIDWIVEKGAVPLLTAHPGIRRVIEVDTRKWRGQWYRGWVWREFAKVRRQLREVEYDVLFDFQGNVKSAVFTKMAKAQEKIGFSWKTAPEFPNAWVTTRHAHPREGINVRERYLELVRLYASDSCDLPISSPNEEGVTLSLLEEEKEQLKSLLEGVPFPRLMICFGSKWPNKQLSLATWKALIQQSQQANCERRPFFLFIAGTEEEKEQAEELLSTIGSRDGKVVSGISLPLWHGLMGKMDGIVAVDSVGLHLAGTTGRPTFGIFGSSSSHVYRPIGEDHHVWQGVCPYKERWIVRCPRLRTCSTGACMKNADTNTLFIQFQKWWSACQSRYAARPKTPLL